MDNCSQNAQHEDVLFKQLQTKCLERTESKISSKWEIEIKQKVFIVDEYKKYGLGSYGTGANRHRKSKFSQESMAIQKEMKRIGLKS